MQKITIVPRTMGALGYTMQRPEEEKYLNKKDEMLADLVSFFGGRAAEEIKFHTVTTGASNDIERATAIARAMVTQYGMSEEFGLIGLESITNRYLKAQRQMMRRYRNSRQKIWKIIHRICNILVIPCIDLTGFGYNDTIKFTVYRRCHEFCIDRMG